MSEEKPKKHHYIPQGYMRNFTECENELFVMNKKFGRIRTTAPAGVGYIKHYYRVDTVDEVGSAEIEQALGVVESTSLPITDELLTAKSLTNAQAADMAIYIALQYGRTPFMRTQMDEMATTLATNMTKQKLVEAFNDPKAYEEMKTALLGEHPETEFPSREELKEWILKPGPLAKIEIDNGTFVKTFFSMAWGIADELLKHNWDILHAPKGTGFVVSDNPIGIYVRHKLEVGQRPAILIPDAVRFFPLNRKTCLAIGRGGWNPDIRHHTITKNTVRQMNKLIYDQAHQYVISGNRKLLESLAD